MRHAWDQRLDETDSEFGAFSRWLRALPRPAPAETALAARMGWSDRAYQYDAMSDVPDNPAACFHEFMSRVLCGAVVAARRWQEHVALDTEPVDPKTLVAIGNMVARVQEVWHASSVTHDVLPEGLTVDQLEDIDRAAELLQKGHK